MKISTRTVFGVTLVEISQAALQGARAAEVRITEEAKKKFTRIDAFEGIYEQGFLETRPNIVLLSHIDQSTRKLATFHNSFSSLIFLVSLLFVIQVTWGVWR